LRRIEAGAQGEHKLARGYRPALTYSAHEFADARLGRAIADYLGHERVAIERTIAYYDEHAPFRRSEDDATGAERLGESFDADV
jgi:predicted N-acyltransferase